jgi:hypothetical protein
MMKKRILEQRKNKAKQSQFHAPYNPKEQKREKKC